MTTAPTPGQLLHTRAQLCFCGEKRTALTPEPLIYHSLGCIIWDWALARKFITPQKRMQQLDQYAKKIGDPGA